MLARHVFDAYDAGTAEWPIQSSTPLLKLLACSEADSCLVKEGEAHVLRSQILSESLSLLWVHQGSTAWHLPQRWLAGQTAL